MDRDAYWNQIHETKATDQLSWFEPRAARSLEYIQRYSTPKHRVLDAGGGVSPLVDGLLDLGYSHPIVLDVSDAALKLSRQRLGNRATLADWVVADVTQSPMLPEVDLWHDRAVLHFLTEPQQRSLYARLVAQTLRPQGHVVLASFALEGPERCSGLPVQRHDASSLARVLGSGFELLEEAHDVHRTPSGDEQAFIWTVFRKK